MMIIQQDNSVQAEEIRSVSFVESVFCRPGMYTINGTLVEVLCFLEGYYSGMMKTSNKRAWQQAEEEWAGFLKWCATKLCGNSWAGLTNIHKALRRDYPQDAAAFERCLVLYAEYEASRTKAE